MKPYYKEEKVVIYNGDCLEVLQGLGDNSIDSIVTDPPYELGFMGKSWDNTGIANNVEMWSECLRVLKPGGHLLSFGGTRTYHRMAVAIEDAGFEVRDMIEWVYGSGFPKSLNIGKAVDKLRKGSDKLLEFSLFIKNRREELKISQSEADKFICGGTTMYSFFEGRKDKPLYFPNNEHYKKMKELFLLDDTWDKFVVETNENIVGFEEGDFGFQKNGDRWDGKKKVVELSKRASEWEGWGTALKPAHEPICMARKPLAEKTVAENCLKWGTGGINIDESRVDFVSEADRKESTTKNQHADFGTKPMTNNNVYGDYSMIQPKNFNPVSRFPANLIHDNSEEVRECFPETKSGGGNRNGKQTGEFLNGVGDTGIARPFEANSGNASRFFKSIIYQAKASKSERNRGCEGLEDKFRAGLAGADRDTDEPLDDVSERFRTQPAKNNHPTVKPIALMEYLIKMVTPKGGVVLDPFMGSGSTGVASKQGLYSFVGIDLEQEYCKIAKARIGAVENKLL